MNVHNPVRYEGESFSDYKKRRAESNLINRESRRDPNYGLVGARKQLRNEMRMSGSMGLRTRASDALMAAWASKRVPNWKGERDEHGAYTLIGRGGYGFRRIWLAGISSQRGF